MHRHFRITLTGLTAATFVVACGDSTTGRQTARPGITDPSFTLASGFVSTLLARGNAGSFHIQSKANKFEVEIKAKDNTDIAVSSIAVAVGGNSGWHSHPGPVLVVVKTGSITFYNAPDCVPVVHNAGTAFVEPGGDVGLAQNEGAVAATGTATFFAPQGAALRIDQPAPGGNCPP